MPLIIDEKEIRSLGRKTHSRRVSPIRPPVKAERFLRRRIEIMWEKSIVPTIQRIKQAIESGTPLESLSNLIEKELRTAEFEWGTENANILDMWMLLAGKETREMMKSALTKSLGVDVAAIYDDSIVSDALAFQQMESFKQISTIPQNYIGKLNQSVMDNIRGIPLPEGRNLIQQIDFLSGKENFKKHAKLIARDQTAKMTSVLNQTRQQMIGVEMYVWRTAKDQRVVGNPFGIFPKGNKAHGNHWMMEGLVCRWDDASIYSIDRGKTWKKRTGEMPKTHPGIEIQCRCYAEPIIDIKKIIEYAQAA